MRMVKFKLNRECREITVNPAKVLYVCHYEHGASCIHFGKECFVRVQGDLDEVVAKIEVAFSGIEEAPTAPVRPADALPRPGAH